ncbi:hypothetical protein KUTeg_012000 [Tegillarca granosa]|uniref:Uncharacterized protein n=1 Tax=Tegillarca granosa TaxID=220873 RepID=A0ABQ9F1V4_TEGGR|nr:hypothetical protein KUTeg_012000 [Tegillarca granosa]
MVKKYYERKTVISPYPKTSSWDNFLGIPLSEVFPNQELSWLQMEESTLKNILEEKMLSFGSQNK